MSEEALLTHAISKMRKTVLIIIGIFISYHMILHLGYTTDSCKWLLSHGRFVANRNWQPFGCLMYTYNKTDSKSCLRQTAALYENTNYFVIAGDTRMLQLYQYITDHLLSTSSYAPPRRQYHINDTTLQRDQSYHDESLSIKLEFLWRPFITDELFHNINTWILASRNSQRYQQEVNTNPRLLVIGSALWNLHNKHTSNEDFAFTSTMAQYKRNLTRLTPMIDKLAYGNTKILWTLQDPIDEDLVVINATNAQIDELNYATESILNTLSGNKNIHQWSSSRTIATGLLDSIEKDGIHYSELALEYKAQIIMNLFCNPINNYEGTCCSDDPQVNLAQFLLLTLALLVVLLACFMIARYRYSDRYRLVSMRWQRLSQQDSGFLMNDQILSDDVIDQIQDQTTSQNSSELIGTVPQDQAEIRYLYSSGIDNDLAMQLAQLGAIVIYFFICDQTNFFMKENKYFTLANFLLPITYVFALGLFFTEQQTNSNGPIQSSVAVLPSTINILNRNQTDEWKGWMQLVILIYNMSGAKQNLRIYMLIRVLLSSYLFLTGYGHFTYFWETRDLSIKRLWKVLFRLNMLALCLCVSMNRPYQSYYFISLVSIWFLIIFLFMSISPSSARDKFSTNGALKMFIKFSILLGAVTFLYLSEVFLERIFSVEPLRPWRQSSPISIGGVNTDTDSSIQAWWLHWSIDRYSVPAGMIFAYVMWLLRVHDIIGAKSSIQGISCERQPTDSTNSLHLSGSAPAITVSLSIVGIVCYAIFVSICQDRSACDEVHAYIAFIPIVAFIILRNSTEFLRQRHSVFFAFFGRISLETSLCQYHIWLAAGTYGILVLVPSYPTLNLVITSLIFITVSHKLSNITSHLIPYCAQADDWRTIIRNMIVFLLIVAPISLS